MKLTDEEKKEIREAMQANLGGTPAQEHREMIVGLLSNWVFGLIEERDNIFKRPEKE